ncbi:uncharacterized protein LOC105835392 isoform X2 [Monomorium pharaonis]|uniref:uncharacterized protein LOC105835392 isoform X2 n=1 Tax=Monomorium pharaonis TaxID=307658 RepID=UPI00063EE680|nr:uncharacterized protein LOC105835392 isoform X2 [Monomorium pharaonis]
MCQDNSTIPFINRSAARLFDAVQQSSGALDMPKETRVVIVGAGAAGIAAASRLLQRGMSDFVILEANDRIGGRIYTKNFGEHVVDLGAQWVHGQSGNVVYELASKHNLLSSFIALLDPSRHEFANINGEIIPNEESTEALMIYFNNMNKMKQIELKEEEGSFGDYFIREYYKAFDEKPFTNRARIAEYLSWIEKMENSIQCSDSWFDVSAKRLTEYWECEGDPTLDWKNRGYKTIFDLLLQKIPNAEECLPVMEKIEFGKVVVTINYSSDENVTVITRDGCEYSALHVIFTGSLGVLKDKHSTMFVPSLSQKKQRAIEGLNIGTANKIFLEFSHRWWPEDKVSFNFIWSDKDKKFLQTYGQNREWLCDVFSFFTVAHQPNLLCAWIAGKNARHMETLSDVDVLDGLYLLLKKSFEKHYTVVKPIRMLRSKWYTDEHFRGSYSFQSMFSEQIDIRPRDLAEPIVNGSKPVILFAGEATHDHYYSTVHGAVETGFREADRIIEFERTCNHLNQLIDNFDEALRIEIDTNTRGAEKTRVVIVGAGIAGLAAAKTLEDAGFTDYLLLEAQDVVGGRIYSVPWDNGWIDCGAQFLHGDKSRLAQYCLSNDLLSNIQGTDGDGIFLRDDGTIMNESLVREIDDLVRTVSDDICESRRPLKKQENIGSVLRCRFEDYLHEKNDSPMERRMKEEIFDWNVRFLLVDNCCYSLDDLSAVFWGKFKYVGGPEHLLFKSGYSSLTNLLVDNLDKQKVRLTTSVETIHWRDTFDSLNDSPITVKIFDGTKIFADAVIVTCSLGYLKENHKKMFQPLLPSRLNVAIENLGFGTINKIFLDFGEPWWQRNIHGFQLLWSRNLDRQSLPEWTKDVTGFDVLPTHAATLIVWVGGRGACIIEDLTEETIAQDCMNLLTRHLRCHDIPPVKKCVRTKWNGNKYVRGGYSHITKSCEGDNISPRTLAEPIWATMLQNDTKTEKNVPIILFAGEATHDEFYSTTHGAYETGIYQAEVFLQYHVNTK